MLETLTRRFPHILFEGCNGRFDAGTPFSTGSCVAMAGTFGYELDVTRLSEEERQQVRKQICRFKECYDLIQYGEYYRLLPPSDRQCTVWEMTDLGGREALVTAVYHHVGPDIT